jgi:hypothetical protein
MAGSLNAGPLGSHSSAPVIDEGTLSLVPMPQPGPVGATAPAGPSTSTASAPLPDTIDPDIEALDLSTVARKAAYTLKKSHPLVSFTSGRRSKDEQASAMASNVVKNRKWIQQTYANSTLSAQCQEWLDNNPDKKTLQEITEGLVSILNAATDDDLGKLSKHLSGEAFDVQPVPDGDSIKTTIRGLPGLTKFLDVEGGLVRWHAQF